MREIDRYLGEQGLVGVYDPQAWGLASNICTKDLANSLNHHERRNQIFKYFVSINTGEKKHTKSFINSLHNISMHILSAVFDTFPEMPTRRVCLTIKSFFGW